MEQFYTEIKKHKTEIEKLSHNEQKKYITKLKYNLSKKYKIANLPTNIQIYLNTGIKLITKPTRTISGVSVIAIMTKPLKCPHMDKGVGPCIMCPGGVKSFYGDVPQSYTGNEPATIRAIRNEYDPYLQTFNRLEQYVAIGQNFNKIELIIMGGTFPSYDLNYQNDFIMNAYKAMNDFSKIFFNKSGAFLFEKYLKFFEMPSDIKNKDREKKIIDKIKKLKEKNKKNLDYEKKRNESSIIRCIALAIETRPDYCKEKHIKTMLNQGCTRIELGVQSIYDKDLDFLRRGHNVKDIIESTKLMKDSLLKVGYHMMIGINSKESEIKMFKELFSNDNFKPDALKIYPLLVIKGTKLYDLWLNKKYKAITNENAIFTISNIKKDIPKYVRIMRVERDIPHTEIIAGVTKTNLRQYIELYMKTQKWKCNCIRCNEIKNEKIDLKKIRYDNYFYNASDSIECFISALYNDKLIGFLRLRKLNNPFIKELDKNTSGVRELHVYGQSLNINEKSNLSSQHKGIGKKLMSIAEDISFNEWNCSKIAVISGIGVREYYKKLGYYLDGFYMVKKFKY